MESKTEERWSQEQPWKGVEKRQTAGREEAMGREEREKGADNKMSKMLVSEEHNLNYMPRT